MNKKYKTLRCKSSHGLSCQWRIGEKPNGKWKAIGLGSVKRGGQSYPLDFVPFELSNAVMNGPEFDSAAEAENFVRSL